MAKISFYGVDGEERSYTLHPQLRLRIGRDPGNDVVLRDPKVSRRHAEVVFERGFFVLHDLQSANGTYLNGRRINIAPLTNGSEMKLGNSHGRFSDEPDEVPKGTVMGRENPDEKAKPRSTAEMPPDEWQTHPHQRGSKRSDYTAPPSQTALDNRRSPSADQIGDTSLMEEATDDSEPESRSRRQSPFDGYRFEIPRGVPWGELTAVRSEDGVPRLFYRRTFNIVGLVASAVSILVLLAGSVVSLFLALDGRDLLAGTAMGITLVFTVGILLLVPRRSLAILGDPEHGTLAMRVRETTLPGLPNPTFEVSIAEGSTIGYLIKRTLVSFPSRQWKILGPEGEPIGKAKEDGLIRPFFRKFLGDLFGVLTTDYRIVSNGATICRFLRRGDVRRFHALTLEKSADPTPDTRLLLAFAFVIDLLEKSR
jgi:hypothetical protein